jgi:hypothetical protein
VIEMATGSGSATLAFGAAPGTNIVTATVTGQTGLTAGSHIEAWIMGEATAYHNAYEHSRVLARLVSVTPENISGTSFDIVAATELRLTGDVACRFAWST